MGERKPTPANPPISGTAADRSTWLAAYWPRAPIDLPSDRPVDGPDSRVTLAV
jgi:hypothetical protein